MTESTKSIHANSAGGRAVSGRREAALALTVVAGTGLVALYALEALLAFASPSWVDRLGTTLRRGPSVVGETRRLRDLGIRAYPYLQPDTFADSLELRDGADRYVTPLSGIPGTLTVLCNESGAMIGYRSDSLGFRNPDGAWDPGPLRVAVVGDSFAQGFCRPDHETISSHLRAAGIATVNAGLTGAGPLAELGVVREFLTATRPPIVLWLFYEGNDLIDITSERETSLLRYLEPGFSRGLRARKDSVGNAITAYADSVLAEWAPPGPLLRAWGFLLLRRLRTATGLHARTKLLASRDETSDLVLLERILAQAQREIHDWGGEMRLVYLPERRRFNRRTAAVIGENHDPSAVERAVTGIARDLGLPVVNIATAFAAETDPTKLWNDRRYHYNSGGYALASRTILSQLDTR